MDYNSLAEKQEEINALIAVRAKTNINLIILDDLQKEFSALIERFEDVRNTH